MKANHLPSQQLPSPPGCTTSLLATEQAVVLSLFTALQNICEPMQNRKASRATQKPPSPPPPQKVTQPHKRLSVVQELAFGCLPPLAQTGRSSIFSMAGISRRTPGNVQGKQAEEQQNLPETGVNLVMARLKAFSRSI